MATRTISTRLAIEGESQYRAAIKNTSMELKALESTLKLTESSFQGNEKSMEALTAKGKALDDIYKKQTEKVELFRQGLENAQAAEEKYAAKKEELTQKIEENQKALEELRRSTEDTSEKEAELEVENESLNQQLKQNDGYLDAASKGVTKWKIDLNKAKTELNSTNSAIKENNEAQREHQKTLEETTEKTKEQADALNGLATIFASSGITRGVKEITAVLRDCSNAAADFEQEISNVAALSGASSEEITLLSDKAKELGSTTKFTAAESAQAMGFMAMAGWNASQMLEGMDAVLQLAAASGEDLATTADIVTDNLTAFKMTAADTARFSDVLAAAATNSNTSVSIMGETFKNCAALAGTLNYSIEDVAVAVGLMANQSIKGSAAGTALKNMFTGLVEGVTLTSESFGEIEYSAVNADGTVKSFGETMNELRVIFGQMTESEQLMNAKAIAGQRAMQAFAAIMNSTEDDVSKLSAAINNCSGAAATMADIKINNLNGKLTIMQSALDGVKIAIGEQLNPALGILVDRGTDALTWAKDFIQANEWLVPALSTVVIGMTTFTVAATGLRIATTEVGMAIAAAGKVALTNPFVLAATAVATLGTAILAMCANADDSIPKVSELTEKTRALKDAVKDANTTYDDTIAGNIAAEKTVSLYISRLAELDGVVNKTEAQQREYHSILTVICDTIPELAQYIDLETDSIEGGTEALTLNTEAWKKNAEEQAKQERLTSVIKAHADAQMELAENEEKLKKATEDYEDAQEQLTAITERLDEIDKERNKLLYENIGHTEDVADKIQDLYDEEESLVEVSQDYQDIISKWEPTQKNLNKAIKEAQEVLEDTEKDVNITSDALKDLSQAEQEAEDSTAALNEELAKAAEQEKANADAADNLKKVIGEFAEEYKKAYDAAYSSISGQTGLFGEFTASLGENFLTVDQMVDKWKTQSDNIAAYTENIEKAIKYHLSDGLVEALSDGSAESAAYLQEIIDTLEGLDGSIDDTSSNLGAKVAEINSAFESTEASKQAFATAVADVQTEAQKTADALAAAARDIDFTDFSAAFQEAFENLDLDYHAIGSSFSEGLKGGIESGKEDVALSAEDVGELTLKKLRQKWGIHSPSTVGKEIGGYLDEGVAGGITAKITAINTAVEKMSSSLKDKMNEAAQAASNSFINNLSSLPSRAQSIGEQTVNGMISGIENRSNALYSKIASVVNEAMDTANKTAEVASPSKRTTRMFEYVGDGMVMGLENKRDELNKTAKSVTLSALDIDFGKSLRDAVNSIDARIPTIPTADRDTVKAPSYNVEQGAINITINTPSNDPEEIYRVVERNLDRKLGKHMRTRGA